MFALALRKAFADAADDHDAASLATRDDASVVHDPVAIHLTGRGQR